MKTFSIMDLRRNVYAVTKELPVEITAKGEILFFIVKELSTVKQGQVTTVAPPLFKVEPVIEPIVGPGEILDFCKGHWEEVKGKKYLLRKITYEDENANPVVNKQWLCDNCIKKWEESGVGRVYFL